ncbi:MAG: phosphatase [Bacillota bacterium]|nr:phosphatase [Bacillota bacterium]
MKLLMDTHTHSVASGHAYSTVDENIRWAAQKGLEVVALTDHAPGMKDTTGHAYFANLHVLPQNLHGVRLLRGIELNIMDFNGTVDMDERVLSRLDLAIASLHVPCIAPGSKKENTAALVKAMENPYVDIIGHPGDPRYDVDYKEVFRQAQQTGTLLEINNASLIPGGFRDGSQENVKEILRMCMEAGQPVVLGSDAHFYTGIGDFSYALSLLAEVGFPEELVLNIDPQRFLSLLKRR